MPAYLTGQADRSWSPSDFDLKSLKKTASRKEHEDLFDEEAAATITQTLEYGAPLLKIYKQSEDRALCQGIERWQKGGQKELIAGETG